MKFFLTVALLVASAAAAPGKVKRDILPGDSRYGTEYHLQHHHAHSSNSVDSGYLPPVQQASAPAPQVNNQYLAPVQQKQTLQLPSTTYGVPFTSSHTQVSNQYLAPVAQKAPITSYGTPVQVPQNTYVPAPAPVVHQQPGPVYGHPVHHHQVTRVHHQPTPQVNYQSVPHVHYQPATQVQYQPAPPVHYQPAPQENLVFEAPVQSIEVAQSHTVETSHTDSVGVDSGSYAQQQTGSNGGYVY